MSGLKRVASRAAGLEPAVVALAAPFLLFPTLWPAATLLALVALPVVWLVRWIGTGRPGPQTPLDGPLLVLCLMIPVGVWASAMPELTLPRLTGLILGLAAFRAVVNAAGSPRRLWTASLLFLALGLGVVLAQVAGATWFVKWPALEPILSRMPRPIEGPPDAGDGIKLAELGATVLLVLPVSLGLAWAPGPVRGRTGLSLRVGALLVALVTGAALILSQSRSAWIGAAVGIGVMAWLRWPRLRWPLLVCLLLLLVVGLYLGPQVALRSALAALGSQDVGQFASLDTLRGRVPIWDAALRTLRQFPLTGIGLGTFGRAVFVLFPGFMRSPTADIWHAHNVFLQVGLDLGILGLIAYLALVGTALWIGWCAARAPITPSPSLASPGTVRRPSAGERGEFCWLGLGIVGSLVAFHVFGLTDTVALGARPGAIFWMLLGLAAALWIVPDR